MGAEFKSTQRFVTPLVGILPKMAKNWHLAPKSAIFNYFNMHFQQKTDMFVYIPYSISDYILANLNCQKFV